MGTTTSPDGTTIGFDKLGHGPPLIMTVGAFNTRGTTAALADELKAEFTVYNYDRRGRGDSTDVQPYAVEREIEDLSAVIAAAGGAASVFAYSSGANLALKAAASGLAMTRLALYEPPFIVDDSHPRPPADLALQLSDLIAAGRRGDAVELYQTKGIGMPEEVVAGLREASFRPALEALAHTLAYDAAIIGDLALPTAMLESITTPTLVIEGEKSPPVMRAAARAVADTLPAGELSTLPGQGHDIDARITAALLIDWL